VCVCVLVKYRLNLYIWDHHQSWHIPNKLQVARFAGYVVEHSAYHHGERSIASTIMAMAQDFVGSDNNINLLEPRGPFGSRNLVG
jgi:DNA gyrase/topoisomerase IV subunit A